MSFGYQQKKKIVFPLTALNYKTYNYYTDWSTSVMSNQTKC